MMRNLGMAFLVGTFCLLTGAAFDGEWPFYTDSAVGWLGLVAFWIVIAVVGTWAERRYKTRKAERASEAEPSLTPDSQIDAT